MKSGIVLRKVKNLDDLGLIEKWENDLEIRPYFFPNFKEADDFERVGKHEVIKRIGKYSKTAYMVDFHGETVGYVCYDTGLDCFDINSKRHAMVQMIIGEKNYWNLYVEKTALLEIEGMISEVGVKRAELSVFSFNERALSLYQELGYREIDVNEKGTYAFGGWHRDIRMGKDL